MGTVIVLAVVALLGLLVLAYFVAIYNQFITLSERAKNAFSQIEVQLKRRHDLIPNLVETARAYMAHEQETLTAVIQARNQAVAGLSGAAKAPQSPAAMESLSQAEGMLSGALGRLNMVVEQYPDLKANENMAQLSEELTHTENTVAFARQAYNDSVTAYNTYRKTFPAVLIAPMSGHTEDLALLEFEDSPQIQAVPQVSF